MDKHILFKKTEAYKIFQDNFYSRLLSKRNTFHIQKSSEEPKLFHINEIITHKKNESLKTGILYYTTTKNHTHSSHQKKKKREREKENQRKSLVVHGLGLRA